MCLGLCTNRFNPFRSFAALYSCWLVILTVYNLLPEMCIRPEFLVLSTIILGFNSPGQNINVFIQPLIYELKQLWSFRALTYDVLRKQFFFMKAALM
jgi:hypothetical protein